MWCNEGGLTANSCNDSVADGKNISINIYIFFVYTYTLSDSARHTPFLKEKLNKLYI